MKVNIFHEFQLVLANDYRVYIIACGVFVLVTVTGSMGYLCKKLKRLLSIYVIDQVTFKVGYKSSL